MLQKAIKAAEMDGLDGLIDTFEAHLNVVIGGIQELEDRDAAEKQADTPVGEVTIDIDTVKPLLAEMAELLESDLMEWMKQTSPDIRIILFQCFLLHDDGQFARTDR